VAESCTILQYSPQAASPETFGYTLVVQKLLISYQLSYWLITLYGYKVKVKLSLCLTKNHTLKTYWGVGITAPRILNLVTRCR